MGVLTNYPAAAVLRADDLARATKFYTDVLGFSISPEASGQGVTTFAAGAGTMISVYERPGMPAPANTTVAFPVPAADFDSVAAGLRAAGVVFEEYDIPEMGLKTVSGVAMMGGSKTAWFKDSEGNILNLVTM